ncbi:MAG TPA: GTP-binding protein [Firmicutes bacterium]|nr:GTP-binding protein [Bacillota bacterium]
MKNFKTVPITLITGYLGSGKTTLINYLLKNASGYKMAVIVNDIGEVNIDADLIEKGGVVAGKDDNLVALQNGCICCTLKKDLIDQLAQLIKSRRFDHILIEASGICEPVPIAQTITYLEQQFENRGMPKFCKLDAIVSVTDALRLADEFGCGSTLESAERGEEDIENLVIQQIEFCDIILLNKVSEVTPEQLANIKAIIRKLQPHATILDTNYCRIDLKQILDTGLFDFEKAMNSAGWMEEFDRTDNEHDADEHEHHHHHGEEDDRDEDEDTDDDHGHGHHHHHHHEHGVGENDDEGTAEEYGIGTYVYFRRRPFDRLKFEDWANKDYGRMIIRTKGLVYFTDDRDLSYVYEQAGKQKYLTENGEWYACMPAYEIDRLLATDEKFAHDWDPEYGDRMIKLVFIGQQLDRKRIKEELDKI